MGCPKVLQGETESAAVKDNFELELLQAQYKELKEKVRGFTFGFYSESLHLFMHCAITYMKVLKQESRSHPINGEGWEENARQ